MVSGGSARSSPRQNLVLHSSARDRTLAKQNTVKMLHDNVDDSESHSGLKRTIGEVLESHKVEMLIILLLVVDIAMVIMEGGIDLNIFCINGNMLEMSHADVIARAGGASSLLAMAPAAAHSSLPSAMSAVMADPMGASFAGALSAMPLSFVQMASGKDDSVPVDSNPASLLHKKFSSRWAKGFIGADGNTLMADSSLGEINMAHETADADRGLDAQPEEGAHGAHHAEEALVCEGRNGETVERIEHRCHQISVSILTMFLVELLLKIWIHPKEFFSRPLHVLDLFVVIVSLICDVIIVPMLEGYRARGQVMLFTSALMVLRMWRVVRVMHGLSEVMHKEMEGSQDLASDLDAALAEIKRLQVTGGKPEAIALDQPGTYRIIFDGTSVTADATVESVDVGKLDHSARVHVEEVRCVGTRIRGRISEPVPGWISLVKTETGQRWATSEAEA